MKRNLSLTLMMGLGILTGFAQNQGVNPKQGVHQSVNEVVKLDRYGNGVITPINNTISRYSSSRATGSNGKVVGTSYYDLMSNSSIDDRMWLNSDGTISACFTMAQNNSSAFTDRGAGYLYYDGTKWTVSSPTTRVETERCGWPSIAVTSKGKEIILSHSTATDQLVLNHRATKGTGNWTQVLDPNGAKAAQVGGTGYTLWPRMTVGGSNGETVHLIALSEPVNTGGGSTFNGSRYKGIDGAICYSRSKDGGVTWDKKSVVLSGIDSSKYDNFNADSYAITARGDVVAIAVFHRFGDITVLKSYDNGDTWKVMHPLTNGWGKYALGDFPIMDTVTTSDNTGDVIIDNNNEVHVAFGTWTWTDPDTSDRHTSGGHVYTTFPFMNGLNYWKESYGENGHQRLVDLIDQDGSPNISITGGISGLTDYGSKSLNSYPVLAKDAQGSVYLTFMGIMETRSTQKPFNDGTHHYRHQFLMKSGDGGCTWGKPMDLTDAGSGYEECVYGTMPSEVKDSIHLIYMEDLFPGTNVGPVGQNNAHSIVKNEMVYVSVHKTAVSSTPDRCLTVIAGETKLCAGDSIYLDASASCGSAYKWNTGASTAGIWVSSIGTYSCEITTPCGKITEEVEVTTPQQGGAGPNVSLTADLNTLCPSGSQTVLRVNHSSIGTSGFYNWNGNTSTSTVDTFLVTGPGTYSVRVTNCVGGSTTETITINSVTEAKATISGRKFLCPGDSTTLMVSENPDGTYEWRLSGSSSVLSNSSSLKVTQTGTYVVDVSACNRTFTAKDSIKVEVEPAATASLTSAGTTTICKGEAPLSLVANGQVGATYKWFDGSTGGFYTVNTDSVHTFGYFFHSFNACGDSAKSNVINVTVKALPSAPTISYNGTTYSGAGANGKWYFQKRGTTTWVDAGVTGDTYTPTNLQGGDKVMARVVENGCESANSNELVDVTSVLQLGNSGGMVNVFPNPASGSVNVSFTGTENGEVSISIRNMVGQEVASKAVTLSGDHTENIDLSHLETGVYMVVISNDDKQVSQQLIVK